MIISNEVVWVCNPNTCWSLVRIEQTPRNLLVDENIVTDAILDLITISQIDCVTLDVVDHVVIHTEEVRS